MENERDATTVPINQVRSAKGQPPDSLLTLTLESDGSECDHSTRNDFDGSPDVGDDTVSASNDLPLVPGMRMTDTQSCPREIQPDTASALQSSDVELQKATDTVVASAPTIIDQELRVVGTPSVSPDPPSDHPSDDSPCGLGRLPWLRYQDGLRRYLPEGWEKVQDTSQRTYYVNHNTQKRSWSSPLDELPEPPMFVESFKDRTLSPIDEDGCLLPPRWLRKVTATGSVYFADHGTKSTGWGSPASSLDPASGVHRDRDGRHLPNPWRRRQTKDGRTYYADPTANLRTWTSPAAENLLSAEAAHHLCRIPTSGHNFTWYPDEWSSKAAEWIRLLGYADLILSEGRNAIDACYVVDKITSMELRGLDFCRASLWGVKLGDKPWPASGFLKIKTLATMARQISTPYDEHAIDRDFFESSNSRLVFAGIEPWRARQNLSQSQLDVKDIEAVCYVCLMAVLTILFEVDAGAFATILRLLEETQYHYWTRPGTEARGYPVNETLMLRSGSVSFVAFKAVYESHSRQVGRQSALIVLARDKRLEPRLSRAATARLGEYMSSAFHLGEIIRVDLEYRSEDSVPVASLSYVVARAWLRKHWGGHLHQREFAYEGTTGIAHSKRTAHLAWRELTRAILEVQRGHLSVKEWSRNHEGWGKEDPYKTQEREFLQTQQQLFEAEIAEVLRESKILREILDLYNTERALEASERSMQEQHAIGRLTQLAFIFLPLTFITGIFGMNIKPFNDGAPMWKFWVTTCCILLPSWFFGLWTTKDDLLKRIREQVDWWPEPIRRQLAIRARRRNHAQEMVE